MAPLKTQRKYIFLACLSALSFNAAAAEVDTVIKYITGDYGTPYDYDGYKAEVEIRPDDSRWFYVADAREYNHQSGQQYSRFSVGAGYQFPIGNGFIKPEFKIRSQSTDYGVKDDGTRGSVIETDSKILQTQYVIEMNEWFKFAGEFTFFHHIIDNRLGDGNSDKHETYSLELEPALRFHPFKPFKTFKKTDLENATINFIYYSIDTRSLKGGVENTTGGTFGLDDSVKNQQLRIETNIKYGDWTFGPYARLPLTYAEAGLHYNSNNIIEGNAEQYKLTRLGMKAAYKISKDFALVAEYYNEEKAFRDGYQHNLSNDSTTNAKVLEVGFSYDF